MIQTIPLSEVVYYKGRIIALKNGHVLNLICNADSYLKDTLFFSLRLLFAISLSFFIGSSCEEKIAYVLNKLKILSIIILRLHINCSTFQHCTNYQKSSITHSYFTYRLYVHLSQDFSLQDEMNEPLFFQVCFEVLV